MSKVGNRLPDGTIFGMIAGVVRQDAEEKDTKKGRMVKFTVRTWKNDFMDCACFSGRSESDVIQATAALLEAGDVVLVAGEVKTREWDGKEYQTLYPDFISVMMHPAAEQSAEQSADGQSGWADEPGDGEHPF